MLSYLSPLPSLPLPPKNAMMKSDFCSLVNNIDWLGEWRVHKKKINKKKNVEILTSVVFK